MAMSYWSKAPAPACPATRRAASGTSRASAIACSSCRRPESLRPWASSWTFDLGARDGAQGASQAFLERRCRLPAQLDAGKPDIEHVGRHVEAPPRNVAPLHGPADHPLDGGKDFVQIAADAAADVDDPALAAVVQRPSQGVGDIGDVQVVAPRANHSR